MSQSVFTVCCCARNEPARLGSVGARIQAVLLDSLE